MDMMGAADVLRMVTEVQMEERVRGWASVIAGGVCVANVGGRKIITELCFERCHFSVFTPGALISA